MRGALLVLLRRGGSFRAPSKTGRLRVGSPVAALGLRGPQRAAAPDKSPAGGRGSSGPGRAWRGRVSVFLLSLPSGVGGSGSAPFRGAALPAQRLRGSVGVGPALRGTRLPLARLGSPAAAGSAGARRGKPGRALCVL